MFGIGATGLSKTARRAVHISIVSPPVSDVRHIAAASPRRSFQTLEFRPFRDKVGGYPVRIKITNPDQCPCWYR
jgi:predicted Zn-ribbon and HTH transcriptional regulator